MLYNYPGSFRVSTDPSRVEDLQEPLQLANIKNYKKLDRGARMIITETIFVLPSWQEERQITRAPAREKKQRESINQNLFNQAAT